MSRHQVINAALLTNVFTAFNTAYQGGLTATGEPDWKKVATYVPSSARTEEYGWLDKWPGIREWIGDRQVKKLTGSKYSVTNKSFESTVSVDRDDLEDDQLGIYSPMFQDMGQQVKEFPDSLVFGLLADGFAQKGYDGQNFFDTDHPAPTAADPAAVYSNTGGGSGTPWFLLDTTRALKPLIHQDRRKFEFTAMDKATDANVFTRKEYIYGVDGRCNAGFGFHQMAYGSKQTLDEAAYKAARAAMMGQKHEDGTPLRIRPSLLVVGASKEGEARELLLNERTAAGATNTWRNTADLLVCPFLD